MPWINTYIQEQSDGKWLAHGEYLNEDGVNVHTENVRFRSKGEAEYFLSPVTAGPIEERKLRHA